ncbi:hypothetical protein ACFWP5_18755 [Streptomyces sp. NPDC058469]|uniref:hypothetical protein n=1 Tax=Streptomyces sp. NPDC058469 TaxID=3346514 RepID=UPI0036578762
MGEAYFSQDGNGGIDGLHYGVRDGCSFRSERPHGRTALDVRAPGPVALGPLALPQN